MRREDINGHIDRTASCVRVEKINLKLDNADAWALCNLLTNSALKDTHGMLEKEQIETLRRIGRDLGILIDHPSRDNLGKFRINIERPVL